MKKAEKTLLLTSLILLIIHLILGKWSTHILFNISLWLLAVFYSIGGYYIFKKTISYTLLRIITGLALGLVFAVLPRLLSVNRNIEYVIPLFFNGALFVYHFIFAIIKKDHYRHQKGVIIRSTILLIISFFFGFLSHWSSIYQTVAYNINRDNPYLKANINMFKYQGLYKEADENKQFDDAIKYAIKSKNAGLKWLRIDSITSDSKSDLWHINGAFTTLYDAYTNKGTELYNTKKFSEALRYYQLAEKELYFTDSIPKSYRDEAAYIIRNQALALKEFDPELADSLFYKAIVTYQELIGTEDILLSNLVVDYAESLKEQDYYIDSNSTYRFSNQIIQDNKLIDYKEEIINNNQNIAINLYALDSLTKANKIIDENYGLMNENSDYYCPNLFYDAYLKLATYELNKAEQAITKSIVCYQKKDLSVSVAESFSLQSSISLAKGSYNKAKEEVKKAIKIIVKTNGKDNLRYYRCRSIEASINLQLGNYTSAEKIYTESIDYLEKVYGKTNIKLIDPLLNLAKINFFLGRFNTLASYTENIKHQIDETVDISSIHSAPYLNKIAYLYYVQDNIKVADSIYNHILKNKEKTYLKANMATTLNGKGLVELYNTNYKKSDSLFQKALDLSFQVYDKNHPNIAKIYYNIAQLNLDKGDLFLAKMHLKKAKDIAFTKYPDSHDFFADINFLFAEIARTNKEEKNAQIYANKALNLYLSKFGNEHYLSKKVQGFIDIHL